jgi:polysaccharide export outer membrane protein
VAAQPLDPFDEPALSAPDSPSSVAAPDPTLNPSANSTSSNSTPDSAPNSATLQPLPRLLLAPASTSAGSMLDPTLQPPIDGYQLDTGDRLQVEIFDVPEFSNRIYLVLVDGTISVPWIGSVRARGLTPQQLASALSQAYRPFVKTPIITVNVLTPRPVRIGVSGEVNRPGSYAIEVSNRDVVPNQLPLQWPDVTRAIVAAGGITPLADIRNIRLRRSDPGGNPQDQTLNLWQLLESGDLSQNILLRDGDMLMIPKASTFSSEEVSRVARASFAPETIGVNVVGEVKAPGLIKLPPNATLNQAVLAAGGFLRPRAISSQVDLIRINPDGSATARRISLDLQAGLNEETNPLLLNNDIVVINTNGVTRITDFLRVLLSPVDNLSNLRRLLAPSAPNFQ